MSIYAWYIIPTLSFLKISLGLVRSVARNSATSSVFTSYNHTFANMFMYVPKEDVVEPNIVLQSGGTEEHPTCG